MAISASAVQVWNRALSRVGHSDRLQSVDDDDAAAAACADHWDDILREVLAAREWPWAIRESQPTEVTTQSSTTAYASLVSPYEQVTIPAAFVDVSQLEVVHIDASDDETTLEEGTDYTLDDVVEGASRTLTLDTALGVGESVRITVTTERQGWTYLYRQPDDCVLPLALEPPDTRLAQLAVESRSAFAQMDDDAGTGFLLCSNLAPDAVVLHYIRFRDHVPSMPRAFVNALAWRLAGELADSLRKDTQLAERCLQRYDQAASVAFAEALNIGNPGPPPTTPGISARG